MSELAKNLSITALMLVAETLAAKELYYINRTTENFESLCEKRGKLKTYIAELEAAQRWIPVSEPPTVYRDGYSELIPFLVCTPESRLPFRAVYDGDKWGDGWNIIHVTHWMPLPQPPEVQE